MAAKIKATKGAEAELAHGSRGSFEVYKDGTLVFSKLALGRFPTSEQEIILLL